MTPQTLAESFSGPLALGIKHLTSGTPFEYSPQSRYKESATAKLHAYGSGSFCKFSVRGLPGACGVYLFVLDERVVYVGKATNLKQRFGAGYGIISPRKCFEGGQQTNCRINKLVLDTAKSGKEIFVRYLACENIASVEAQLIHELDPIWNRARPTA